MKLTSNNVPETSPSLLKSVLTSAVEAELSHLQVEVKDIVEGIHLLNLEVHKDLTGRYINFDKFYITGDGSLLAAQTFYQDLENITLRIVDGQIKSDDDYSTQEFQNLQVALTDSKTALSVIYQFLSIDCALKSVSEASEKKNYFDAALCYSKIPPMFAEVADDNTHQHIHDALKKQCNITCNTLKTFLGVLWKKTVSWHETGEMVGSKTKSVSLKILKDQAKPVAADILMAFSYIGSLQSILSVFGMSLLKHFLFPVMTKITKVVNTRDCKTHIQFSVEINTCKERPPLSMVIANLKVIFRYINEEMNIVLGDGDTTMKILGGLISKEFSKTFLKECLTEHSEMVKEDFPQILEEFRDLVDYLSNTEFLQCDYLIQYSAKLVKASDEHSSFLECATLLKKARSIMRQDMKETLLMQQDSSSHLCENRDLPNGYRQANNENSEDGLAGSTSFSFPTCRVSKWIVELVELLQGILTTGSTEEHSHRSCEFLKTAQRIVDLYAAIAPVRHAPVRQCTAPESLPLCIALFHNNTMFLAHQLALRGFDVRSGVNSDHPKFMSADLIDSLRSIATGLLLKYLNEQRTAIVEKTKAVDISSPSNACADLENAVKQCILQTDRLHSAWKDVLPADDYARAMGGIVNSWLEELTKLISHAKSIPGNTAFNIAMVFKNVAERISFLLESDIHLYVSRLGSFQALIDILDSSLSEVDWKCTNGTLAHHFGPENVQNFVRVLFGHFPASAEVLARIK